MTITYKELKESLVEEGFKIKAEDEEGGKFSSKTFKDKKAAIEYSKKFSNSKDKFGKRLWKNIKIVKV